MAVGDQQGETLQLEEGEKRRQGGGPRTAPALFLVLEVDRPLAAPSRHSLAEVDEVIIGRGLERQIVRSVEEGGVRRLTLRVPDRWISSTHARLSRVLGRWVLADAGSKNGTLVAGARVEQVPLADGDMIELGHTVLRFRERCLESPLDVPADVTGGEQVMKAPPPGMATISPELAASLATLAQLAASTVSIIVHGESGTGKELCARAIHTLSGRRGAFVAVNCGALPETLVETELFGYKKGAFSGAGEDRLGLVRAADGGTLFLDEIGDLPASSQAAFLRVLQEREVTPVGATRALPVDLRVVAASHRQLDELVQRGRFRADLLARLSGFTITLPPLRERLEDLGLLVGALLQRLAGDRAASLSFTPAAVRALARHDWPLNVRELEKALSAACVLARDGVIDLGQLPANVQAGPEPTRRRPGSEDPLAEDAADDADSEAPLGPADLARREALIALFREHGGNVSAVARTMGKARMQIQRWMKRYKIEPEDYRR
jgi:DNA-binding NtrC family response regulator